MYSVHSNYDCEACEGLLGCQDPLYGVVSLKSETSGRARRAQSRKVVASHNRFKLAAVANQ
jgi:hypothetical protein